MKFDKFIRCNCGKNKKISWIGKADFNKGKVTFCIGISLCKKCELRQEHYSGDIEDIQAFINYRIQRR